MGGAHVAATVAWDTGSDTWSGADARGSALIGSLDGDVRLGARWTAQAGGVSNLRIPTFAELPNSGPAVPVDRSVLAEVSLAYTDLQRLRVAASAFRERTTGTGAGTVAGLGIDTAWQIAPALALRSWLLAANQTIALPTPSVAAPSVVARGAMSAVPGSPLDAYGSAPPAATALEDTAAFANVDRRLMWLTYESGIRVDALVRTGPLEGDVRIPIGGPYAVTLGTAEYAGHRFTTIGVTRR